MSKLIYVISGEYRDDYMGNMEDTEMPFDHIKIHHLASELHPMRQLIRAKNILKTQKRYNKPLVIYTYSPYLIEALARYVDESLIDFIYFDGYSLFEGCGLENIFKSLSKPFEVFREMDKEKLNEL